MGTPEFAVPSLAEIISSGHNVIRVYTQPPRRAGRGKQLTKSPVHQFAELMGIPVDTPESFRKSKVIDGLEALEADVACVVAYGQILPQRALDAPKYGCLNLHGSLLPRWRGAAPVQRAIMAGDAQTGVQIMQMAKGLDTGDILLSETTDILPSPFPGAWCEIDGRRVKVHLAQVVDGKGDPGVVLDNQLTLACGQDALRLVSVQPAGKSRMTADDFLRGAHVPVGTKIE